MVYTFNQYEWDPAKAESNFRKHGIRFEDAVEAILDPEAVRYADIGHSSPIELRQHLVGECISGILLVVYTVRLPAGKYRIISARPANRKERERYGKAKEEIENEKGSE